MSSALAKLGLGASRIGTLRQKLTAPAYKDALVVVAWERHEIVTLAQRLMAEHGGGPGRAPA